MTEMSPDQLGLDRAPALASATESAIRGLLHDLGHQLMTVSLLAESLQAHSDLPAEARRRSRLVAQETVRALDMIASGSPASPRVPGAASQLVDVRDLTAQVAKLTGIAHQTPVLLLPGQPAFLQVDPMLVWRVLCNIVDNAARAAGPDGQVDISISRGHGTIITVTDSGDGFGNGPAGTAGIGLSVVRQLLATVGGHLDISTEAKGGTSVRAVFGSPCDRLVLPRLRGAWTAIA